MFNQTFAKTAYKSLLSLGTISFIHSYLFDWCPTAGASMEPLIDKKDNILLFERLSTLNIFKKLQLREGDVVIAKPEPHSSYTVCKRIIGTKKTIKKVDENGVRNILTNKYFWLEGDNKENSMDSRMFGYIPQNQIIGRVIFKIWPPNKITRFRRN